MKLIKTTSIALLLLVSLSGFSNNKPADNEPKEIIKTFFSLFESVGNDSALNYFFSFNKYYFESSMEVELIKLKAILNDTRGKLGKYYDYEIIEEKKLGKNFITISAFARFDRQPLKFLFTFYRVEGAWRTHNFRFTDELGDVEE